MIKLVKGKVWYNGNILNKFSCSSFFVERIWKTVFQIRIFLPSCRKAIVAYLLTSLRLSNGCRSQNTSVWRSAEAAQPTAEQGVK